MDDNCIRLFGITGKKFSGKSTLASMICMEDGAIEKAFANSLKEICSILYSVSINHFHDPLLKEKKLEGFNKSPREMMQKVGTIFRDEKDDNEDNMWIRRMRMEITNMMSEGKRKVIVISDVRYPDEARMVRDFGGIIIRIIGNHTPGDLYEDKHSSETMMEAIAVDKIVHNDGSKSDLKKKVQYL